MAGSMKCNKPRGGIRSISFPSRPHSSTYKMEQELNKIKTWEAEVWSISPSSETICNGLFMLAELYRCKDELLNSPLTRQALSRLQHDEWINEYMNGSIKFIDICGSIKDIMSEFKSQIVDLHSVVRRKPKGEPNSIAKYTLFRKKINKDAKRLSAFLKQVENITTCSPLVDLDHYLIELIRVLNEVTASTISVFQYVFSFFSSSSSSKLKATKWSLVSRIVHKNRVACEDHEQVNEIGGVDMELLSAKSDLTKGSDSLKQRLQALETGVEGIENGLECMFRHFIRTRHSLLNIVSQ